MSAPDSHGYELSGASPTARDRYETALSLFLLYSGDPLASIEAALADSPGFAMAHLAKAWMNLLGTEPAGISVARQSYNDAKPLARTPREKGHLAAVGYLVEGKWHKAARMLQRVSADHPYDLLALQAGHQVDFFTGNARLLRDRIARALPEWKPEMPGYHGLLGMHAFGLEEMGDYQRAESQGKRAVELQPRDSWAQHAVAHVMEMQGRTDDGIAWMRANPEAWSKDSFFAVHNWWHLALYHLDRGEYDEVLKLFDGPIFGARSSVILELIDASAMLWRLHLRGVDVGSRWTAVAQNWAAFAKAGNYAFNDVHAVMAFIGAGRYELVDTVLAAQERAAAENSDNALFTREVGRPIALALKAFAWGDYAGCVSLLMPVIPIAARFGGSHAQRDLLDLTLIEAAVRGGDQALARALTAERQEAKPASLHARTLFKQVRLPTAVAA